MLIKEQPGGEEDAASLLAPGGQCWQESRAAGRKRNCAWDKSCCLRVSCPGHTGGHSERPQGRKLL